LRLAPGGLLIFSNNFRRFKIDMAALSEFEVNDITPATIPRDFARNARIHQCFEIRVPPDAKREPRATLSIWQKPPTKQ
jgi:23S rRNA (guanine2445-N2)-methyltransferase / 23S rRNA (guanine2069-N7)-methyltransferase